MVGYKDTKTQNTPKLTCNSCKVELRMRNAKRNDALDK